MVVMMIINDEDEDGDEEDDDGDGDDDMMRWMLRTRRKIMVRKENGSQDRETHCARACAIEMHISQEPFA